MPISGQVSSYSVITYTMNSYRAATTSAPVATMSTQNVQSSNAVTYNNVNVSTVSTTYGAQGTTRPPTASVVYSSSMDDGIVIVKGAAVESTSVTSVANTYSTLPAPTAGYVAFKDSGGANSVVTYNVTTPGVVVPEQSVITPEEVINTKPTTTPAVTTPDILSNDGIKTPLPSVSNNSEVSPTTQSISSNEIITEGSGTVPYATSSNQIIVNTLYRDDNVNTPAVAFVNTPLIEVLEKVCNFFATASIKGNISEDIERTVSNDTPVTFDEVLESVHTALDISGFIPVYGDLADIANTVIYILEGDVENTIISGAAVFVDAASATRLATKYGSKVVTDINGKSIKEILDNISQKSTINTMEEISEKVAKNSDELINTLTDAQKSRLKSLENTINDHLTENDFSGTLRDLQGNPVPNGVGGYFDHAGEMRDSYRALTKIREALEGSLQNPNLSDVDRKLLDEGLDKANSYIQRIEDLFNLYGGL